MAEHNWKKYMGLSDMDYPVPEHANSIGYMTGGLTFVCFLVTFITGIVMTQFYSPSPTTAHTSVLYLNHVPWLRVVRSLHFWSANIGFAGIIIHMVRVILSGAFRPPRIFTYLIGVGLLFVSFQIYFTGTVLKWDQEGYEGMSHFIAVNKLLGPLGKVFLEDYTLSTSMLSRFYALHIAIFPIFWILLMTAHAFLIKQLGISPKPGQSEKDYARSLGSGGTFMGHVKRLSIFSILLVIVLLALAVVQPAGLGELPKAGVEITKPPWPFWIFYPIESAMGIKGILIGSVVLLVGLLLVPVLGLLISTETKLLKIVRLITAAGLLLWGAMLVTTYFSPVMSHM